MKTHRLALLIVFALAAGHALAQTPPPKPPPPKAPPAPAAIPEPAPVPPPPPAPPAPPVRKEGQAINIRVETTINETGGNAPPVKKSVIAVAGDGENASVREIASVISTNPGTPNFGPTSLNVDASPTILPNGKIRTRVTMQYAAGQTPSEPRVKTDVRQTLVLILENGKPLVISEASDPVTDRRVTVEVTATILK
jgi:hypothetical protein